jgi:GxxExxY protein
MDQIKSIAQTVFRSLGAGFSERIYHNSMEVLLTKFGIPFKSEQKIPVIFEGVEVGEVRADLVIDGKIVVELKSVRAMKDDHVTQCEMYMKLLGINQGMVINFPCSNGENVDFQELVETPVCNRCGRDSHLASGCFAKNHINGYRLSEAQNDRRSSVTIKL